MTSEYVKNLIQKAYEEKAEFLDLGNCGLTQLPEEITRLAPFLKELNLGLIYTRTDEYTVSSNYLSKNDFSESWVSFPLLEVFDQLKALYMYSCPIPEAAIAEAAVFKRIAHLDISDNQLTDAGAASISPMGQLTHLYIRNNQLTDAGAASLSQMGQLTYLNITNNHLTDAGAASLSQMGQLTYLNITNNQLTDAGAASLSQMDHLTRLAISGNKLTDVGVASISQMGRLTYLKISSNQLTDAGTASISQLNRLTYLDISDNQLTAAGATSISQLGQLTHLNISGNQLTDVGAASISQLGQLTHLYISDNQVTDAGAASLSQLGQLTYLNISRNQLTDAGSASLSQLGRLTYLDIHDNQLTQIESIRQMVTGLPNLTYLRYYENKITGLPKEIGEDVEALRAYFASTQKVANTLVKMILIGNTRAGKSSLAGFLVNKEFDPHRESTHGIQLWRWAPQADLQVNIWDFGGQDYYHATHNLFLDDKTIFILLQSPSEEQGDAGRHAQCLPVNYWLGNIRSVTSKDSAIWYVQSKSETEDLHHLNSQLANRYAVGWQYKISVKGAFEQETACVRDFNYFLHSLLPQLEKMTGDELPASWVEIRDKHLPKWRMRNLSLSRAAFKTNCEKALKNNFILLEDLQKTWEGLLPYLKGCGEVIYFTGSGALNDKIFLSAERLTAGIYALLSQKALDNKGEFTLTDLEAGDQKNGPLYLAVLQAFEIIFEKPGNPGVYVAPQYLPENPYTRHFQQLIQVAYIIHFPDYMSRSLITRFLVQYAGKSADHYYWRYGAFFKLQGLNIFVRIDADLQKIYVHVEDGGRHHKFLAMKELFLFFTLPLSNGVNPLDAPLHNAEEQQRGPLPETEAIDRIPGDIELSLNDTDFAAVDDIKEALRNRAYKIKSRQGNFIEFNAIIHQLLSVHASMPKKIFLSYSHKDEAYKKELDTHFAALKRSGKVETWNDRQLTAGEDWDAGIAHALMEADIALLLLSPDFMASDYIWQTEIPKALAKGVTIVPIFIRPCDFKDTVFGLDQIQGLPRDCQWIASRFAHPDEGYLQVVEGVKGSLG